MGDWVQGELIQWAREQQELTMRWVNEHGGPSLGYQSEVERGLKQEVSSEVLAAWVRVLNVTPAFARGQVPRFSENPASTAGMARSVALSIAAAEGRRQDWTTLTAEGRTREVLKLIARDCPHLPRVVLAYVLGVSPATLDEMMLGTHPILVEVARAIMELTALPDSFWMEGELERPEDSLLLRRYLEPLRQAVQKGISPEEMTTWVRRRPLKSGR